MKVTMMIAVFLAITASAWAQTTWYVPDDFPGGIQAAISDPSVLNNDTIIVRPGTYGGPIDFMGKHIAVMSEQGSAVTVIEGDQTADMVTFDSGEGVYSVLDGFTVRNGRRGIVCINASPTVRNNVITGNVGTVDGAGVYCSGGGARILHNRIEGNATNHSGAGVFCGFDSTALIRGNFILGNSCQGWGGGIECDKADIEISSNILVGNSAYFSGGGIDVFSEILEIHHPFITNNTIVGNQALTWGGGGVNIETAATMITNTIIWDNSAPIGSEIALVQHPVWLYISYSVEKGGASSVHVDPGCVLERGPGMLTEDPVFVDPLHDDYHVARSSPCINRGLGSSAPPTDVDGDAMPCMGTVEIGADEFTGNHTLSSDAFSLSVTGGIVNLSLDAGAENAGRWYLILGSLSGWFPGTPLPNNGKVLPIQWDDFTRFMVLQLNGAVFSNFVAVLGGSGQNAARIIGPPVNPAKIGEVMTYAYCLEGTPVWDFVSNPMDVEFVP